MRVYDDVITHLKNHGMHPKINLLTNKTSAECIATIIKHKIDYQLTLTQIRRRNLAERVIQTAKNNPG